MSTTANAINNSGAAPAEWQLDAAHSAAHFSVRHMMVSNVRGEFGQISGSVRLDPADITRSTVTASIDATTIHTREPQRDTHLKSADFLDVEKYPTLEFRSTGIVKVGEGELKLTGNLTLHGVTREVTFDVEGPTPPMKDPWGNVRIGATAATKINRKEFGLEWNGLIEGGGVLVGEVVTITIEAELTPKA